MIYSLHPIIILDVDFLLYLLWSMVVADFGHR